MSYGSHHAQRSPLMKLVSLNMIHDFPIGDSLHLIDLGITKRLIIGWRSGSLCNAHSKLSNTHSTNISAYLDNVSAPFEIRSQRRIRGFKELRSWKAIEYRNFLLYTSIVALKYNIRDYIYEHFILYFCAITIFSSPYHLKTLFRVAEKSLSIFVDRFKVIYGIQFFSSNVHNLAHLSEDVQRFGSLDTFNSYPFESKLYTISRLLRTGNLPLEQLANRIAEQNSIISCNHIRKKDILKRLYRGAGHPSISEQYTLYSHLQTENFLINCERYEDSWILTKRYEIFKIKFIANGGNDDIQLCGSRLKDKQDFFTHPISSSDLLIFSCLVINLDGDHLLTMSEIKCKLFPVSQNDKFITDEYDTVQHVFIPILKSLK